jgi:hypothetical protein
VTRVANRNVTRTGKISHEPDPHHKDAKGAKTVLVNVVEGTDVLPLPLMS